MNKWTASLLSTGYEKCIIGFDVRISFETYKKENASQAIQYSNNRNRKSVATIDSEVWPEQINKDLTAYQHGLNLFDRPLEEIEGFEHQINSIQVAFDLPITLASTLVSTFGIVIHPIEMIKRNINWEFLGYDIIDARTQASGFYSFDWSELELIDILNRLSLKLNEQGLVDDESLAIKTAVYFDAIVKEHAPFSPCGIWVLEGKKVDPAFDRLDRTM